MRCVIHNVKILQPRAHPSTTLGLKVKAFVSLFLFEYRKSRYPKPGGPIG